MASIRLVHYLAVLGFILLRTGTCQPTRNLGGVGLLLPGPNSQADVLDTVMTMLNQTSFTGKRTDANVQEIVSMLMNGTAPSSEDLVRLGFIPKTVTTGGLPTLPAATLELPTLAAAGGLPTLTAAGGLSTLPAGGGGDPKPTVKPLLGDPFSLNLAVSSSGPLPGLGLSEPNALGPKLLSGLDPIGGFGAPGSSTDVLGSLGMGTESTGGVQQPTLQSGIMEPTANHQRQNSNPMMMMYMMNPEVMEGMMAESPMMAYMMMQQMAKSRQRAQVSQPSGSALGTDMGFVPEAGQLQGGASAGMSYVMMNGGMPATSLGSSQPVLDPNSFINVVNPGSAVMDPFTAPQATPGIATA